MQLGGDKAGTEYAWHARSIHRTHPAQLLQLAAAVLQVLTTQDRRPTLMNDNQLESSVDTTDHILYGKISP